MSSVKNDNESIIKSNFFLKLYCIPVGVWLVSAVIALGYPNESERLTFGNFIGETIFVLIFWFAISFLIARFHKKRKLKKVKKIKKEKKQWEQMSTFDKVKNPFIMSIFTFLIGILLSYDSVGFPLKAQLIILLVAYIPFILFILITFIIYTNNQNKKVYSFFKTSTIVATIFLLFYYFIALFVVVFTEALNPMTNPTFYSYHVFVSPGLKDTFPSSIPKDVEDVSFYYAPGFLQGGTRHILYYIDKKMTIVEFDNKYKNKAIWIGHKEDYKENPGLLSGAFYSTPSEYNNENDYVIYLIEGSCDGSGYCNHGEFKLAAFNETTHEVVYSSETW